MPIFKGRGLLEILARKTEIKEEPEVSVLAKGLTWHCVKKADSEKLQAFRKAREGFPGKELSFETCYFLTLKLNFEAISQRKNTKLWKFSAKKSEQALPPWPSKIESKWKFEDFELTLVSPFCFSFFW